MNTEETTKQLTQKEAIDFFDSEQWKQWDDEQVVKFQLFQERACLPFARFQEAMENVLDRPVYTHELGANVEKLKMEYRKRMHDRGLGVPQGSPEDRSEAKPECGPAGTATPKESVICVEALEKEGWEKVAQDIYHSKGDQIRILFGASGEVFIWLDDVRMRGVSSMQDLRTLELLVNGPQK